MAREYFRPLGLVNGPDARRLIEKGEAGALGGSGLSAFTLVNVMDRSGGSRIVSFQEAAGEEAVQLATRVRPMFAGLDLSRPRIMGVVNVTPDSFSDGGLHAGEAEGIAHARKLAREGAVILDVGGESTRPGSDPVAVEEELSRTLGVVKALVAEGQRVSIDTRKARVMQEAVSAGAAIINDVSALTHDPQSIAVAAKLAKPLVLMHAQGDPRTMQLNPQYDDVALDVFDYLGDRVKACLAAGIPAGSICVDPGIGFGKSFRHNLEVMQKLTLYHGLGVALLAGVSRKGFIGALTGEKLAVNRAPGSVGGALYAASQGVHIVRVHDVRETAGALAVFNGMADPESTDI